MINQALAVPVHLCFAEDKSGDVWFGDNDGSLSKLVQTGSSPRITGSLISNRNSNIAKKIKHGDSNLFLKIRIIQDYFGWSIIIPD